jgi:hypothetical protein
VVLDAIEVLGATIIGGVSAGFHFWENLYYLLQSVWAVFYSRNCLKNPAG